MNKISLVLVFYIVISGLIVSCGKTIYVPGLPPKRLSLSLTAQDILLTLLKDLEDKLQTQGNLTDKQIKDILVLAEDNIYVPVEQKKVSVKNYATKSNTTKISLTELQTYAPLLSAGAVKAIGSDIVGITDLSTKYTTLTSILDHSILSMAFFNENFTSNEKLETLGLSITNIFQNLNRAQIDDFNDRANLISNLTSRCVQNVANIKLDRRDNIMAVRYCLKNIVKALDYIKPPSKLSFLSLLGQVITNGHSSLNNGFLTNNEIVEISTDLVKDEIRAAVLNSSGGNELADLLNLIAQIAKHSVSQITNNELTKLQMAGSLSNILYGGLNVILDAGFGQDELAQAVEKYVQSAMEGLLKWTGVDNGQLTASLSYLSYGAALGISKLEISQEDKILLIEQLINSIVSYLDELGLPPYLIQSAVQSIAVNIYEALKNEGWSATVLSNVISSLTSGATSGLANTGLSATQQADALTQLASTLNNPDNYIDPYKGQIDFSVIAPAKVIEKTISVPSSTTGTVSYSFLSTSNTYQYALRLCSDKDCGLNCSNETLTTSNTGSINFSVADGNYYFCTQSQNPVAGQKTIFQSSSSPIIIDNTIPGTPTVSDPISVSLSTIVPISFTAVQDANFVEYEVDMCGNNNCTSCAGLITTTTSPVNFSGLLNGQTYYACVWQKDVNQASPYGVSINSVTIDVNLPVSGWSLTVSPLLNGGFSNDPTPIISRSTGVPSGIVEFFDASGCNTIDSIGTQTVISNSISFAPTSYSTTPGIDDGFKDFHAQLTSDGNVTGPCLDIDVDYNYDVTPPAIPIGLTLNTPATSPGATATPSIDVDVTAVADQVQLFTDSSCTTSISFVTNVTGDPQSVTTNSLLADTNTTLYVGASDLAGNVVCSGSGVNLTYFYDSIDPVVTIDTSYPATWDVTISTGTTVTIGPDTTNGSSPDCTNGDGNVTVKADDGVSSVTNTSSCSGGTYASASVNVSGLNDGNITLTASQTDAAGRTGNSSSVVIKKDMVAPSLTAANIEPTVGTGTVYQTSSSYNTTWTDATDATSGVYQYSIRACTVTDCTDNANCTTIQSKAHPNSSANFSVSSLNNNSYYICVQAEDVANNKSAWERSSSTVVMDSVAPTGVSLSNSFTTSYHPQQTINLTWPSPTEVTSGINKFVVKILKNSDSSELFTTDITNAAATSYSLDLTSTIGNVDNTQQYKVTLKAVDNAGLESAVDIGSLFYIRGLRLASNVAPTSAFSYFGNINVSLSSNLVTSCGGNWSTDDYRVHVFKDNGSGVFTEEYVKTANTPVRGCQSDTNYSYSLGYENTDIKAQVTTGTVSVWADDQFDWIMSKYTISGGTIAYSNHLNGIMNRRYMTSTSSPNKSTTYPVGRTGDGYLIYSGNLNLGDGLNRHNLFDSRYSITQTDNGHLPYDRTYAGFIGACGSVWTDGGIFTSLTTWGSIRTEGYWPQYGYSGAENFTYQDVVKAFALSCDFSTYSPLYYYTLNGTRHNLTATPFAGNNMSNPTYLGSTSAATDFPYPTPELFDQKDGNTMFYLRDKSTNWIFSGLNIGKHTFTYTGDFVKIYNSSGSVILNKQIDANVPLNSVDTGCLVRNSSGLALDVFLVGISSTKTLYEFDYSTGNYLGSFSVNNLDKIYCGNGNLLVSDKTNTVNLYNKTGPASWTLVTSFSHTNAAVGFGTSMAINDTNNIIVIGAPLEESSSSDFQSWEGEYAPFSGVSLTTGLAYGAVYVYLLDNGTWDEWEIQRPTSLTSTKQFGEQIDISGNRVVVSARDKVFLYDL